MIANPQDKLSGCTCYVQQLDDEIRVSLRFGAHDPACPLYMPSLDRDHAREDAEFRQRVGGIKPCTE